MKHFFAQLRNILVALAMVTLGTVVLASSSTANDNGQQTCTSAGYIKGPNEDQPSGSETYTWGSMSWADGEIDYAISDGFRVAFCIKQGTGVHESGWRTGSDTFDSGADDMSHVGYRFETRIPATPSVTMVNECGTENDSGPTFDADTTHWTAAEGAGDTVVFTAKDGWFFPAGGNVSGDGYTWTESYTPNTDESCGQVIPVTPSVAMVNECGTENDSGPTFDADTTHWTAAEGAGDTVVFTAKDGWFFQAGENVSEDGSTWTETYTPNTDVPCDLPPQPDPEPRYQDLEACAFDPQTHGDFEAGVIERHGTEAYEWDEAAEDWVLSGTIVWEAWSQKEVWDDDEYFAKCAPLRPGSVTVEEEKSGCDLTEFGEFDAGTIRRTGEQEYVWNLAEREWELEDLADVSWADWTQAAEDVLTDAEYFEECATGQPAAEVRQVSGTEDSCPLGGTLAWTETYTTEYVWDAELRDWVLGEEGDPVREESFQEWSQEKFERLCEVAGEQGGVQVMDHELDAEVEVKGVQETAPPSAVDAGLGTTPFTPVGVGRNPLALVAIGAGLLLLGAAGRRKGATAVR